MNSSNRRKLIFRTAVFIITFSLALFNMTLLKSIVYYNFKYFMFYHIIWLLMMLGMLEVCIPAFNKRVSCGKIFAKHFKENPAFHNKEALKNYTNKYNRGAIRAGLLWGILLAIIGFLYFRGIIDKMGINLIVIFFYFSDQFCVSIWCPFRAWIVKNKCCNSCRIYNWGHFMMFSPYIFIPTFWTYSLVLMSLFIFVQWEFMHYKHPQRFSEISNLNLQCSNCLKGKCIYMKSNLRVSTKQPLI